MAEEQLKENTSPEEPEQTEEEVHELKRIRMEKLEKLKAEGKNPFTIDSKSATADYKDFIMGEARYSSLTRSFPDRAEVLFDKAEKTAKARRAHLEKLLKLYGE